MPTKFQVIETEVTFDPKGNSRIVDSPHGTFETFDEASKVIKNLVMLKAKTPASKFSYRIKEIQDEK